MVVLWTETGTSALREIRSTAEPEERAPGREPAAEGGDRLQTPPAQSMSARTLAENAQAARLLATNRPAAAARRADGQPICAALLGAWRLDGDQRLVLQPRGMATWQHSPDIPAVPVRWLCMQDGTGELQLDAGTWRIATAAEGGGLLATGERGISRHGRREAPAH